MKRHILIIALVAIMLGGTAQAQSNPVVDGNNTFAFDLYHAIRAGEGNIIFSPYSISSALSMLYVGAGGETEQQMADALHFEGSQAEVAAAFGELNERLPIGAPADPAAYGIETQLNVANALWVREGYPIQPAYTALLEENYGAGLHPMDFAHAPDEARQMINDWISDQTEGRIQNMLPDGAISVEMRLVLTNAI